MKRRLHSAGAGFSLVITLIILALLAILVVSFITTATLERTTARAFANKTAAEIAAETATNQAISLLTERITQYPDSATVWEGLNPAGTVGGYGFEGTVLYYTKHASNSSNPDLAPEDPNLAPDPATHLPVLPPTYMLPLVSRGNIAGDPNSLPILGDTLATNHTNAMGTKGDASIDATNDKWTDDNSLDINRRRSNSADDSGWVGAAPGGAPGKGRVLKPYRARWVEIKGTAGSQPASPATPVPGKTISRYAFWVEDESFRVNLNLLDNNLTNPTFSKGRGSETAEAARFNLAKPLPPQIAGQVPIQGLLRSLDDAPYTDIDDWASKVQGARNGWFGAQLFEQRAFNHSDLPYTDPSTGKLVNYPLGDAAKFLGTIYSGGLNMSRNGSQRVNLNGLGFEKDISAISDADLNKQIGQVVQTIKYHAPQFGQRFYRDQDPYPFTLAPVTAAKQQAYATIINKGSVVNATDADTYLYKVAANIRDYIDPDNQPTLILAPATPGGQPTVAPRVPPTDAMFADDSDNIYWAQGKDGAPFIQEVVVRYRTSCTLAKTYDLQADYYVEVWNMSNKDILAKDMNHPFLMIRDCPGWNGHLSTGGAGGPLTATNNTPVAGDPFENRPFSVDLVNGVKLGTAAGGVAPDGVVFKAGACTVISTDPDGLPAGQAGAPAPTAPSAGGFNAANTYYCGTILTGKRHFTGSFPPGSPGCDGIWMVWRDAGGASDYGTATILGNDFGFIDCAPYGIAHNNSSGSPHVTYGDPGTGTPPKATTLDEVFGGSLIGNSNTASQLGDPRTNNEQLKFQRYKPGGISGPTGEPDVTRYPNSGASGYRFTLGWPNANFTNPYVSTTAIFPWKDYYKVWTTTSTGPYDSVPNPTADTAPAFIANENLKSIGQLGDIYDPARVAGAKGTLGLRYSRGGGRTFKIGQKDDLTDTTAANSNSQQWASWRLTDFFDISNEIYQPGLININGVRRDNGAALRAACYGLTLKTVSQATSDANPTVNAAVSLNSIENASNGIQLLVNQAILRLQHDPSAATPLPSYFRERGEVADLAIFNSSTLDLLKKDSTITGSADVKTGEEFDHSREELFRRLAGMITTRGNVFSVYAVGQSVTVSPNGKLVVNGEHWTKTTFALLPKKQDGSDFQVKQETFIPDDKTSREARFAKPHHYDIQLLQVSTP